VGTEHVWVLGVIIAVVIAAAIFVSKEEQGWYKDETEKKK
jgi:hypothetical protein